MCHIPFDLPVKADLDVIGSHPVVRRLPGILPDRGEGLPSEGYVPVRGQGERHPDLLVPRLVLVYRVGGVHDAVRDQAVRRAAWLRVIHAIARGRTALGRGRAGGCLPVGDRHAPGWSRASRAPQLHRIVGIALRGVVRPDPNHVHAARAALRRRDPASVAPRDRIPILRVALADGGARADVVFQSAGAGHVQPVKDARVLEQTLYGPPMLDRRAAGPLGIRRHSQSTHVKTSGIYEYESK